MMVVLLNLFVRLDYSKVILSFEPQSESHKKLVNKSQNDNALYFAPRMALGASEEELKINLAGNIASSSLLKMLPIHIDSAPLSQYVGKEMVKVCRLDNLDEPLIKSARQIYLKIDTQGYEMPVLIGAEGIIDKVIGIQLEMSAIPLYEGQALYPELLAWLDNAGFELWGLVPGHLNQATGRMLQFDGVFFRK